MATDLLGCPHGLQTWRDHLLLGYTSVEINVIYLILYHFLHPSYSCNFIPIVDQQKEGSLILRYCLGRYIDERVPAPHDQVNSLERRYVILLNCSFFFVLFSFLFFFINEQIYTLPDLKTDTGP